MCRGGGSASTASGTRAGVSGATSIGWTGGGGGGGGGGKSAAVGGCPLARGAGAAQPATKAQSAHAIRIRSAHDAVPSRFVVTMRPSGATIHRERYASACGAYVTA